MTLDALRNAYGHLEHVCFHETTPGFPLLSIDNFGTRITLSLYGAQLLSTVFDDGRERLWQNPAMQFIPGKALRGGIPICWPWFGAAAASPDREVLPAHAPAHGFVRNRLWDLHDIRVHDDLTVVELRLNDNADTRAIWPYAFEMQLQITVQRHRVRLRLRTYNNDEQAFLLSGALHSYFACRDVAQVNVSGLEHAAVLDQLTGLRLGAHDWHHPDREIDRIYRTGAHTLMLSEPGTGSPLLIYGGGSTDTVVWNPWRDKAARLGDITGDDWRHFICLETAIAGGNAIRLAPGGVHKLSLIIRPLSATPAEPPL